MVNTLEMTSMDIATASKRTTVESFLSQKTDTMRSTMKKTLIRYCGGVDVIFVSSHAVVSS